MANFYLATLSKWRTFRIRNSSGEKLTVSYLLTYLLTVYLSFIVDGVTTGVTPVVSVQLLWIGFILGLDQYCIGKLLSCNNSAGMQSISRLNLFTVELTFLPCWYQRLVVTFLKVYDFIETKFFAQFYCTEFI